MMTDLIRTSMFCDVNDVFAEDELQFLANMEKKSHDVIIQNDQTFLSDNFLEFVAQESDKVDEFTTNQTLLPVQASQCVNEGICRQTSDSVNVDNVQQTTEFVMDEPRQCCNGSFISSEIGEDFLSRIVQASKVDFSTFRNVSPGEIFGNDYLQTIDVKKDHAASVGQLMNKDHKARCSSFTGSRLPYSYAACIVTAIYISGKRFLSINDIFDQLCIMFEEVRNGKRRALRKRISTIVRTHVLFKQTDDNCFYVVPGHCSRNTFHRQVSKNREHRERYASMIHDHFGVPSMLDDLGIKLEDPFQTNRKKDKKLVSDLLKHRKLTVRGLLQSTVKTSSSSTSTLQMPQRPCFHDDSDNDDDELLSQNFRQNVGSNYGNEIVGSDKSEGIPQNARCFVLEKDQCTSESAINIHPASVVVPTPRYAVPTPSACIPLRSQEYHIPFVGTFKMVDMYYNGQIIHQLFV